MRKGQVSRETRETAICAELDLDGSGRAEISTGIGFFDHMLTAFAVHSDFDLTLTCKGDLEVDCHHTIEDVGIVLGQAIAKALGEKGGIRRYGSFYVPMDEALGFCSMDISGRPFLVFDCPFSGERVGAFDTCMTGEFFRAVAVHAGITLHLRALYGANDHHKIEAIFKAFAHSMQEAVRPREDSRPLSSKGVL
ncbi:MAG: imidazoleglycerol-phosphate dehydratase HisB [Oscillospiraceae bacterium]|nr:imidazoleglycerol-phosphate dehydratase HisB [Oscillospiraceae bacterium]